MKNKSVWVPFEMNTRFFFNENNPYETNRGVFSQKRKSLSGAVFLCSSVYDES